MFFLWVVKCFTRLELLTASATEKAAARPFLEELDLRRKNLGERAQATVELARRQVPDILPANAFGRLEGLSQTLKFSVNSFDETQFLAELVVRSRGALDSWSARFERSKEVMWLIPQISGWPAFKILNVEIAESDVFADFTGRQYRAAWQGSASRLGRGHRFHPQIVCGE